METEARLDELRAEARHRRAQRDLYRAKMYGPRATSVSRMKELERRLASAEGILSRAIERSCDHSAGENSPAEDRRRPDDGAPRRLDRRLR